MTTGWICKECNEKQYMSDTILHSGSYSCPVCGCSEFQYEHNGVKHEAGTKRKILKASIEEKRKEGEF